MRFNVFFLIPILLSFVTLANGQELDSISMEFENGQVVVRYDFLDGEKDENYELYLFGSHDNFTQPLQYTTGDIGKNIRIGSGKTIYWDAKKELGNFKGDFSLKIKGSIYIPLVSFKNIDDDLKIKRGDLFEVKWTPNTKDQNVLLKIQRNGVPIAEPLIVENSGIFRWEVPSKLKANNDYAIQILDTKNLLKEETSKNFSIRRKVPLAYKIIPAALIIGAGVILFNKDDDGIPNPPAPPER